MKYEESPILELKEIINTDFKKEIVALANTDGGEILVGVARDGTVTGVEHPESEMEKIGNMIRDGIKPDLTAYTSIEAVNTEGKTIIPDGNTSIHVGDRVIVMAKSFFLHELDDILA